MMDLCGVDPVPTLKLVFAEMSLACTALSDAINHAGMPQVEAGFCQNNKPLTSMIASPAFPFVSLLVSKLSKLAVMSSVRGTKQGIIYRNSEVIYRQQDSRLLQSGLTQKQCWLRWWSSSELGIGGLAGS